MTPSIRTRRYTSLSAPEVPTAMNEESVLCLPVGACEQHGPHLPLDTDTVIAERFTDLMVSRYGTRHDLWALPAIPYGLSLEHGWSPGTVSLSITAFTALLDDVIRAYLRATPARRVLIVNGHGGNRGILQACAQELRDRYTLALGIVHPVALSEVRPEGRPRDDSRWVRVWVARGSIAYSAVSQPCPEPLRQRGTPSVTLAEHSTRVSPNCTSTEPSGWMPQPR